MKIEPALDHPPHRRHWSGIRLHVDVRQVGIPGTVEAQDPRQIREQSRRSDALEADVFAASRSSAQDREQEDICGGRACGTGPAEPDPLGSPTHPGFAPRGSPSLRSMPTRSHQSRSSARPTTSRMPKPCTPAPGLPVSCPPFRARTLTDARTRADATRDDWTPPAPQRGFPTESSGYRASNKAAVRCSRRHGAGPRGCPRTASDAG